MKVLEWQQNHVVCNHNSNVADFPIHKHDIVQVKRSNFQKCNKNNTKKNKELGEGHEGIEMARKQENNVVCHHKSKVADFPINI